MAKRSVVKLRLFDVKGREVTTIVNATFASGPQKVVFEAGDLPSGVYFYRIEAGEFIQTKKLTLLK